MEQALLALQGVYASMACRCACVHTLWVEE